jgi:cysteinyl-tRNA synthetase
VDLRFPHHENEQAQSRAAGYGFASYWLHNAWITTAGEKMSKSLGNTLAIPSILQRFRAIELRYYLVISLYRSHVEFSEEALEEAAAAFGRIENYLSRVESVTGAPVGSDGDLPDAFVAAMDDDLATPAAVAVVHESVHEGNRLLGSGSSAVLAANAASVRAMLAVLGLDPMDPHWEVAGGDQKLSGVVGSLVGGLLEERAKARAEKDFAAADAIRARLAQAGIEIEDTPQGPKWSLA